MEFWGPLALIGSTGALLALPVVPAVYELWKRNDAAPLPTTRHDGKITNFADTFRSRLAPLRPQLEQCRARRELLRTSIEGMQVLVVGSENFDFSRSLTEGLEAIVCAGSVVIPAGKVIEADVYADSDLRLEEGVALRAALAGGNVVLTSGSAVLRWLHAQAAVHLHNHAVSYGRLSADRSIHVRSGASFQRLQAPEILTFNADDDENSSDFGNYPNSSSLRTSQEDVTDEGNNLLSMPRQRIRSQGDFVVPAGQALHANLVVAGELCFGNHARFVGSTKSYKDTVLESGAAVIGGVVSGQDICIGEQCFVAGPLIAERHIFIGSGTRIGASDSLTTVSARHVTIAPGSQLHGSVWARVQGTVSA